jgi:hypothetical protein
MSNPTLIPVRQIVDRNVLQQIFPNVGSQTLDTILQSINSDLTPPLSVDASSSPNLTVIINSSVVNNTESGRQKSIPFINNLLPVFTTGTVTFPSSNGGNIVASTGATLALVCPSNQYVKVLISLNSSGNLEIYQGTANATQASALVPVPPTTEFPICYISVFNNAGTIQNIQQNAIFQFTGGGGGGVNFPVTAAQGGTGLTALSPYDILVGGTTSTGPIQQVSGEGTVGQVLTSNGPSVLPSWQSTITSPFLSAIGGTITTVGNFKIHTFTSSGTFTVTNSGPARFLVVGGGGGGSEGGGGAGGFIDHSNYDYLFSAITGAYPVVVGAGGAGSAAGSNIARASNGGNSSLVGFTAIGGGGGGSDNYVDSNNSFINGTAGGSGGGGGVNAVTTAYGSGGAATAGQGNIGGNGTYLFGGSRGWGGGGGGAGAAGGTTPGPGGGSAYGGIGLQSTITGTATYYAGGGGGGPSDTGGATGFGGLGGGGDSGENGAAGTNGTGGGGGGGRSNGTPGNGANGGSGVVIIAYQYM